jgi:leucyl aminopeptidase
LISVATEGFDADVKAKRVTVLTAVRRPAFRVHGVRNLAARAAQHANHLGVRNVCFALPSVEEDEREAAIQFAVEGALMGTYRFDKYLSEKRPGTVDKFSIMADADDDKASAAENRAARAAIARAEVVAEAVCRARDFINEPAGFMTPAQLAAEAQAIAATSDQLKIKVLGRAACARLGMGMFLAVGQGSEREPKFIHMTYKPKRKKPRKRVALVGKGVMFDSGGYSLKPSVAMEDMKIDMSGAAAVISSMGAIAALGSDCEVHAIAACCENMVSGGAYKLGDVLKSMDGTTVEINNTDAEGRLTLGDAITYARTKVKADEIFDFATLTGACMIALGPYTAGVMSITEDMVADWLAAGRRAGEDMWRLPLNMKLKEQLKSHIADLRNTGERFGGAITAGLFLHRFAKDARWVHVDIAGPSSSSRPKGAIPKGGTGYAVATIVEYLTR